MRRQNTSSGMAVCSSCGTPSAAFMTTCSACGGPLHGRGGVPVMRPPPVPSSFTPPPRSVAAPTVAPSPSPSNTRVQPSEELGSAASLEMRAQGLPARLRPQNGRFTEEQFQELRALITEAGKYSQDIANSVVSLQEQIEAKRGEIERLKLLLASPALGDDDLLRRQQQAMPKPTDIIDTPQVAEYKHLRSELELLRNERSQMQVDLVALRTLVAELQHVPQAVDMPGVSLGAKRQRQLLDSHIQSQISAPTASWNIGKAAVTNTEQRDLINCLNYLTAADAKPLQQGTLHFLRVLARRLVVALPNGTRPEIGITVGEVLRELRRGHDLADEAMLPIPTAEMTITEKIVALFLANNPFSYSELQRLLAKFEGKEEELYKLLQKEYSDATAKFVEEQQQQVQQQDEEALWAPAQPSSYRQSQLAKLGTAQIAPTNTTVSIDQREMHARCVIMYKKYNPSKANSKDFNEMLKKYTPEVVLAALVEKYGPEPTLNERRQLIKEMFDANAATVASSSAQGVSNGAPASTPPSGPVPPTAAALAALNSPQGGRP